MLLLMHIKKLIEEKVGFDFNGKRRTKVYFEKNKDDDIKVLVRKLLGHSTGFFRWDHEFFTKNVVPRFVGNETINFWFLKVLFMFSL